MASPDPLRKHLINLLRMEGAHLSFDEAVKGFPIEFRGAKPKGAPHTPWQLLEHLRIAQWDILDFSRNPAYKEMKWPDDYWPKTEAPPDAAAWDHSVEQFRRDLKAMEELVSDASVDLTARIPHGTGQTVLREALLVVDHNSYHLGQLVFVRKMLEGK
jgi:DinB superfamily